MKIYSWNMFFGNKDTDRSFDFIRDSEWDMFCLQEVPEEFLARLRTLPVHVVATIESERVNKKRGRFNIFVVILSRYPIRNSKPILLPKIQGRTAPIREAIFGFVLSIHGMLTKRIGPRHVLCADVDTPHGLVRLFNLHLSLRYPAVRASEFEVAMTEYDPALPTIVCGDFNILESLHITPINFFRGGSIRDVLYYKRERTQIEKTFLAHGLVNALRGKSTHPISQSQLDHILVSHSFSIKKAEVVKDRYGSDHCPVRAEIE